MEPLQPLVVCVVGVLLGDIPLLGVLQQLWGGVVPAGVLCPVLRGSGPWPAGLGEEALWISWAADKAIPGEGAERLTPTPPLLLAGLPHSGRLPASYFRRAPG